MLNKKNANRHKCHSLFELVTTSKCSAMRERKASMCILSGGSNAMHIIKENQK